MTERIKIRKATGNDARALTELALRAKGHWGYDPAFVETCRADIELSTDYIGRARVGILECARGPIGFYGLSVPEKEPELVHLWIDPRFIGKGFGTMLWAKALREASYLGWKKFKIISDPNARGFYEQMGARFSHAIPSPIDPRRQIPVLYFYGCDGNKLKEKERIESICLERVGLEAVGVVQSVIAAAPRFLLNTEGTAEVPDYAERDLKALPPGCTAEQKYYFLLRYGDEAIGVVDLVRDYPRSGTVFIGLFLIEERWQGRGLGGKAFHEVELFARRMLGGVTLRLAFNDTNPVQGFWERMGFRLTGESKPYEGRKCMNVVKVMQKILR